MAKRCAICGKGVVVGMQVSHSNRRTKRTWTPNLQRVRVVINGTRRRVRVCTSCLRKVQRAI